MCNLLRRRVWGQCMFQICCVKVSLFPYTSVLHMYSSISLFLWAALSFYFSDLLYISISLSSSISLFHWVALSLYFPEQLYISISLSRSISLFPSAALSISLLNELLYLSSLPVVVNALKATSAKQSSTSASARRTRRLLAPSDGDMRRQRHERALPALPVSMHEIRPSRIWKRNHFKCLQVTMIWRIVNIRTDCEGRRRKRRGEANK